MRFSSVKDVASWRLCVGCGACAYACSKGNINLVDVEWDGIRPSIDADGCEGCGECVKVCPGVGVDRALVPERKAARPQLLEDWGPVLEIWEGYAASSDVRFRGSSGGVATALASYCIDKTGVNGVLHTGSAPDVAWRNRTCFSPATAELLDKTGSRYAPASPCDGFATMENAPKPSVFIGKGCDVAGMRKASSVRPDLAGKSGLVIGIFCAGTPSTRATLDLLKKMGVDPRNVADIRYRGKGWPGRFTVTMRNGAPSESMPYMEAWEFLQAYRPFRCYLCPDATAELADISCGDPWYRENRNGNGYSLILIRTERGKEIFREAMQSGYIQAEQMKPEILLLSQPGFPSKRGAVWGRLFAMKIFGIPTPTYQGWPLFQCWMRLPAKEKAKSVLGTVRRIIQRKYYKPSSD